MPLVSVNEYREKFFSKDSAPDPRTIRRNIDNGSLAGKKIGGRYFVDTDRDVIRPVNQGAARIFHVAATQKA